jgi:hypothetical protein
MAIVKRIIVLAHSRKRSGLCIAGKERPGDGTLAWVRPVSDRPDEEVSERECRLADGRRPRLLDVIDVPLRCHHPRDFQTENWLLQPGERWTAGKRAEWRHLPRLADNPPSLWANGMSSHDGLNDRVPALDCLELTGSLFLLHLQDARLTVAVPRAEFGNIEPRAQADFAWNGTRYRFRVTDTEIEREYLQGEDGTHEIGECYATVSLGLPWKGYCYKLVAAIIRPPKREQ